MSGPNVSGQSAIVICTSVECHFDQQLSENKVVIINTVAITPVGRVLV